MPSSYMTELKTPLHGTKNSVSKGLLEAPYRCHGNRCGIANTLKNCTIIVTMTKHCSSDNSIVPFFIGGESITAENPFKPP